MNTSPARQLETGKQRSSPQQSICWEAVSEEWRGRCFAVRSKVDPANQTTRRTRAEYTFDRGIVVHRCRDYASWPEAKTPTAAKNRPPDPNQARLLVVARRDYRRPTENASIINRDHRTIAPQILCRYSVYEIVTPPLTAKRADTRRRSAIRASSPARFVRALRPRDREPNHSRQEESHSAIRDGGMPYQWRSGCRDKSNPKRR